MKTALGTGRSAGPIVRRAPLCGAGLFAAHVIGFALLASRCRGDELVVELRAPAAAPQLALDGVVPPALADRVTIVDTPHSPAGGGLVRRSWTMRYRGGVERSVGAAQLVGPFQDPAAPACVGRVVVGQRMIDDGVAGPGTIAAAMQRQLTGILGGEAVFPVGALHKIEQLALRWARLEHHPEDRDLIETAPDGYVRATATIVFDRVTVAVVVALVPAPSPRELVFRIAVRAGLVFDNGVVQWLSDRLGIDRLATRLARRQLDDALVTAFAPPPPFPLPGGQTIRFTYCDEPIEITEGGFGALPFGIALGVNPRDPAILPPKLGHGPRTTPGETTSLALDLDLDALNALLYELWRGGFLQRRLGEAGLDRRFNTDPTVVEFLSLRLAPLELALPPVVSATPHGLRLAAEARVAVHDGAATTNGRVWGGIDFAFAATGVDRVSVDLGELALTCERSATQLVPCYSDLIAAVRDRSAEFHGALTQTFAQLLSEIFVGRLGATGISAELVITRATPSVTTAAHNATLHLELDGSLQ